MANNKLLITNLLDKFKYHILCNNSFLGIFYILTAKKY